MTYTSTHVPAHQLIHFPSLEDAEAFTKGLLDGSIPPIPSARFNATCTMADLDGRLKKVMDAVAQANEGQLRKVSR